MMKGIPQELRNNAWHKRHLVRITRRKHLRIAHMMSVVKPVDYNNLVTQPPVSFWSRVWIFLTNLFYHGQLRSVR